MAKQHAVFNPELVDEFKELLLQRRRQILSDEMNEADQDGDPYAHRGSSSDVPTHLADLATDSFDADMRMRFSESRSRELIEIDYALERIQEGSYGICEVTGKPIELRRLRVIPWARCSLEGQEVLEREGMPAPAAQPRPVWRDSDYGDGESEDDD